MHCVVIEKEKNTAPYIHANEVNEPKKPTLLLQRRYRRNISTIALNPHSSGYATPFPPLRH